MKLRLRENSIRFRLLQSEVVQLREIGTVSETIVFGINPAENLTYSLRVSEDADEISAQMTDNQIEVFLPLNAAEIWADTNEVGLYAEQKTGDLATLKIIVEKDFVCVERPTDADNRDAFPHPKINC